MFGATVLAPILMGFDPNVAIFFSGVATLIFFAATGGRVPSYLGSSFAFIGPVLAATGATVGQPNPNIGLALGGIVAAGALYTAIGVVVMVAGHRWVERLMPPAVTGAIVAAIGLVLAPIAIGSASGTGPTDPNGSGFARLIALLTVVAVGAVAVYAPGLWRRLLILIGGVDRLLRLSRPRERHGARQPDRFFEGRRRGLARPAELRKARLHRRAPSA